MNLIKIILDQAWPKMGVVRPPVYTEDGQPVADPGFAGGGFRVKLRGRVRTRGHTHFSKG